MNKRFLTPFAIPVLAVFSLCSVPVSGQVTKKVVPLSGAETVAKSMENELEKIENANSLSEAKLESELAEMRAKIERLKLETELLTEQQALEEAKRDAAKKAEEYAADQAKDKVDREASIAKSQAELAEYKLALEKAKWEQKTAMLTAEMAALEAAKLRDNFADAKPVYLTKPLKDDGTLVISDRRIALNGAIYSDTADYITERIHYYNNKNKQQPIFIVIDDSPGGSVMAGYRILKAMEGSEAPIHVVVKSFAASMAASITTLAEESYAYPNALILHHQLSSSYFFTTMNLTQQKEAYEDSKKWWDKLAAPIAKKMGVSNEEFIKQMYQNNSDGDWVEFATEAKKLKWVNHIVHRIEETATVVNPDSVKKKDDDKDDRLGLQETVGKDGKPCMYLPRINPHDVYFLYNPDGYYRMR